MRRLCWLLLFFLVAAPLAARADGFALAKQGFQAQKQGQWDEAIRLYGAALDAGDLDDKGRLLVMGLRANALGIRGRYDEAIQAFDAAIRLDPSSPLAYVGRGMVHLQMGDADLAIADDEATMKIAPEDRFAQANRALARFYLGEAALLKGDRSAAQADFRKVLTDCDLYRSNYVYFSRAYGAAAAELKRLP